MTALPLADRAVVLGLDPSLTGFGYSWQPDRTGVLRPVRLNGLPRLQWLRRTVGAIVEHLRAHGPLHLAVIEAVPYASHDAYVHERAALFYFVLDKLDELGVPTAVANTTHVKMIALGKGGGPGTDKPAMVAAARDRLGYRGTDHNESDAVWLAELGYHHLGQPHARLPATHLRALGAVTWPTR